jgi:hypothetical protein
MTELNSPTERSRAYLAINFVIILANAVLRGFAILLTWNWFIATALRVPSITWIEAIGFGLFYAALIPVVHLRDINPHESNLEVLKDGLRRVAVGPLGTIALATIWHLVTSF